MYVERQLLVLDLSSRPFPVRPRLWSVVRWICWARLVLVCDLLLLNLFVLFALVLHYSISMMLASACEADVHRSL